MSGSVDPLKPQTPQHTATFRGSTLPDIHAKAGLGSQPGTRGQVLGGTGDQWGGGLEGVILDALDSA